MLIPLQNKHLEMILPWRNQKDVRQNSFTDHIITQQEHEQWWDRVRSDASRQWLLFCPDNKPSGVVNFYNIRPAEEACWGFYLADTLEDYEKLKIWFLLEKSVIDYAENVLHLKKLKCELFAYNKAALFMHKRSGFQKIDTWPHKKGEVVVMQMILNNSENGLANGK